MRQIMFPGGVPPDGFQVTSPGGRSSPAQWPRHDARPIDCMPQRSRRHLCLATLGAVLPWRAWAGFNFWTQEYTATRAELQAMIAKQFPRSQRYAQIVTVALSDPQLGLDPAAN